MGFLGNGGVGANAFAKNFRDTFIALREEQRQKETADAINQYRQMQIDQAMREQKAGETMRDLFFGSGQAVAAPKGMLSDFKRETPENFTPAQQTQNPMVADLVQQKEAPVDFSKMPEQQVTGLMSQGLFNKDGSMNKDIFFKGIAELANVYPKEAMSYLTSLNKLDETTMMRMMLMNQQNDYRWKALLEQERGRNERTDKNNATRIEIKGMGGSGGSGSEGTWSYQGIDEATGRPILMNSKTSRMKLGDMKVGAKPKAVDPSKQAAADFINSLKPKNAGTPSVINPQNNGGVKTLTWNPRKQRLE